MLLLLLIASALMGAIVFATPWLRKLFQNRGYLPTNFEMRRKECGCGWHLEDSDQVCPNCGEPVDHS